MPDGGDGWQVGWVAQLKPSRAMAIARCPRPIEEVLGRGLVVLPALREAL